LAPSPLSLTTSNFFQLNTCFHNLTRRWVCLLSLCFAFSKCRYCIYSMLLNALPCALCASLLSFQALQSRSCLPYVSYATTAA
jgi:hypothetical protein